MLCRRYPTETKLTARRLRRRGRSYKEIATTLNISKSTAKLWCEDVVLKPEHRQRLYTKQVEILSRGPQSSRERREREVAAIVAKATQEIRLPIEFEIYRLVGAALYWAEGAKTEQFSVTNSDPLLMAFVARWMYGVLGVVPESLTAHLNIYPQQDDMTLKKFWSEITGIPVSNFGKSFVKPRNKGYKHNTLYYGTIKIRVRRGTDIRHRVFGWIRALLHDVAPEVQHIETRWNKLREYSRP